MRWTYVGRKMRNGSLFGVYTKLPSDRPIICSAWKEPLWREIRPPGLRVRRYSRSLLSMKRTSSLARRKERFCMTSYQLSVFGRQIESLRHRVIEPLFSSMTQSLNDLICFSCLRSTSCTSLQKEHTGANEGMPQTSHSRGGVPAGATKSGCAERTNSWTNGKF